MRSHRVELLGGPWDGDWVSVPERLEYVYAPMGLALACLNAMLEPPPMEYLDDGNRVGVYRVGVYSDGGHYSDGLAMWQGEL